ncbi:MAG: cell division protein FtsL [Candidatus Aminicenantes bacterium]|nr:cell division protein FtsL [Candidatus Aminicenantes bacterium]
MKKKNTSTGIIILIAFIIFILAFTYLSLNLKNISSGYEMQELMEREKRLQEEIDKLKAQQAELLNLNRVEEKVMKELGYQYPQADQFLKVFDDREVR